MGIKKSMTGVPWHIERIDWYKVNKRRKKKKRTNVMSNEEYREKVHEANEILNKLNDQSMRDYQAKLKPKNLDVWIHIIAKDSISINEIIHKQKFDLLLKTHISSNRIYHLKTLFITIEGKIMKGKIKNFEIIESGEFITVMIETDELLPTNQLYNKHYPLNKCYDDLFGQVTIYSNTQLNIHSQNGKKKKQKNKKKRAKFSNTIP